MFGVFIFLFIVIFLITQVMPLFVAQRTMYEARERQSRAYSWQAFVLSQITIELAWNTVRPSKIILGPFEYDTYTVLRSWLYSHSSSGITQSASTKMPNSPTQSTPGGSFLSWSSCALFSSLAVLVTCLLPALALKRSLRRSLR